MKGIYGVVFPMVRNCNFDRVINIVSRIPCFTVDIFTHVYLPHSINANKLKVETRNKQVTIKKLVLFHKKKCFHLKHTAIQDSKNTKNCSLPIYIYAIRQP
jgi:hypothetical protein